MELQSLLDNYKIRTRIDDMLEMWNAPHRRYHTESHLRDLLEQISANTELSQKDQDLLAITAIFHDIIYEPTRSDNEYRSAQFLLDNAPETPEIQQIAQMIIDTKAHIPTSQLSALFCVMDMSIVLAPYDKLLEWEYGIQHEYSHLPSDIYKKRRVEFLKSMRVRYPENALALGKLIEFIGSLDQITNHITKSNPQVANIHTDHLAKAS